MRLRFGVTAEILEELYRLQIDVLTSGTTSGTERITSRPWSRTKPLAAANYPPGPGVGGTVETSRDGVADGSSISWAGCH
jgi:hypothetical protein